MIAADDVRTYVCTALERVEGSPFPFAPFSPAATALVAGRILGCPSTTLAVISPRDELFAGVATPFDVGLRPTTLSHMVLLEGREIIVPDAQNDARFCALLQVILFPHARFLAGFPLMGRKNQLIGAMTLVDYEPRPHPNARDCDDVRHLAKATAYALDEHMTACQARTAAHRALDRV
ncbi:MAG: GAF domain-containing protein [Pseudomonadota bacterium]